LRIEFLYNANEYALSFQEGEEKAFDFFFRELFPSLCFFANRILNDSCEAEDIASSAFIKIWKKHSQFDNARSIRSYLYQIVRNDCLKFLQQSNRAAAMQKDIKYLANADADDNCEADIIRSEFFCELYNALNNLPSECRRIFKMLYIEGKTVKETAQELKLSLSTVKTQKARGLAVLKKKIIYSSFILFLLLF
jgi:RNA polymerase sigma-70 factor (ECF subfamily)